jgi:hypothetical protein
MVESTDELCGLTLMPLPHSSSKIIIYRIIPLEAVETPNYMAQQSEIQGVQTFRYEYYLHHPHYHSEIMNAERTNISVCLNSTRIN